MKNLKTVHPTYKGCTVCDEWHNFQVFAKWYDENYYLLDDQRTELDKDILIKGNKTYSPETCVFVPQRINGLFTKREKDRGNLPIGVSLHKKYNKYYSRYNNGLGKTIHLVSYNTPEEVFYLGYKPHKEQLIKEIADEYKGKIPQKLYEAMYKYEVEITD